jgi:8-amino-7-oxononanoate synthase
MKIEYLAKELHHLKEIGLYRSLKTLESPQSKDIWLEGKKVLNFSSNDYLGLANDQRLKKAALEAIEAYGFGSGSSRLICGNIGPYEKLEAELAQFKGTEEALIYSGGYMANIGIISALMDHHSVVISDKLNHASIIDGAVLSRAKLLRYPHANMQALEEILKNLSGKVHKLIVTDSVFSMDGDKAPLKEIMELAQRYEAMVMVDEAHAFGVLGEHGSGLVEELGVGSLVDIQMGTLSKAAGCFGAYVCGRKILKDYLINKSRSFIYTTAMPPLLIQAARAALKIIREDKQRRRQLQEKSDYLRRQLKGMGFDTMHSSTPIIPILIGDPQEAKRLAAHLLEQGILAQAIRPPTVPTATARIRLTVTALHTQDDLEQLLDTLRLL